MSNTATAVDFYSSTAPMRAFHLAWLVFLPCLFALCASALRLPQTAFTAEAIPFLMPSIAAATAGFLMKRANAVRPSPSPTDEMRTRFVTEQANKAQLR